MSVTLRIVALALLGAGVYLFDVWHLTSVPMINSSSASSRSLSRSLSRSRQRLPQYVVPIFVASHTAASDISIVYSPSVSPTFDTLLTRVRDQLDIHATAVANYVQLLAEVPRMEQYAAALERAVASDIDKMRVAVPSFAANARIRLEIEATLTLEVGYHYGVVTALQEVEHVLVALMRSPVRVAPCELTELFSAYVGTLRDVQHLTSVNS